MKTSGGFTLIELLVVISIIGLLASIVLASLNSARAKARDANRMQTIDSVKTALELYYTQHGQYPWGIAFSPWGPECNTLNWRNCNTNHGDPMTELVTDGFLHGPLTGDPGGDVEGGTIPWLGDGFPTDRGFVYCSGNPHGNCPEAPTSQTYVLGTNLEESAGNIKAGDNPEWGTYQFHMP